MKGKYTVILLLLCINIINCNAYDRFRTARVIANTTMFRDAQNEYKIKFGKGNYGSIENLIETGLIGEKFADSVEFGYRFNLIVEKDHYYLSVIPEPEIKNSNYDEELSMYVDDTGVIRASVKPNKPANAESSPIAHQ